MQAQSLEDFRKQKKGTIAFASRGEYNTMVISLAPGFTTVVEIWKNHLTEREGREMCSSYAPALASWTFDLWASSFEL